jgi:membrane fusion protein (multidrug efflux system)
MKKWVATIFGLLVVIGTLGGIKGAQIGALIASAETAAPPPESVSAEPAQVDTWSSALHAVGSVVAVRGVTVTPEVPGLVRRLAFESGQDVRAGQTLLVMDTAVERAELASAEAEARFAAVTLERVRGLRKDEVNSPAELDQAQAAALQSAARVQALRATIGKKTVRAPFAGRLGIRQVDSGQYVGVGTPVVTIQALDELYIDFSLPQRELSRIAVGQAVRVTADAYAEQTWKGAIETIEAAVDASTRNVRVRALVQNPQRRLRPGMFVSVEVELPDAREVVTIPSTAVIYAPYGDSTFILDDSPADEGATESKLARQVFIRTGERRGDLVEVTEGVKAGELVVTSGGFKLRNGAAVVVNNALAPDAKIDPDPEDS